MDDAFIERVAEKLAQSDQALKRFQGPERQSMSVEEDMAAIMLIAEAADMMEQVTPTTACHWSARRPSGRQRSSAWCTEIKNRVPAAGKVTTAGNGERAVRSEGGRLRAALASLVVSSRLKA